MRRKKKLLYTGIVFLALFAIWTVLVQTVDVRPAVQTGKTVGFGAINLRFHQLTGVHMWIYTATDWLGLVPVVVCLLFGLLGLKQLLQRKSLLQVDPDLILLGIYYMLVIAGYLAFEIHPINYRPILIDGRVEASYPSSTTLLVLTVMPAAAMQLKKRIQKLSFKKIMIFTIDSFIIFMVIGRLLSGVHWFSDIIGSALLSVGLVGLYAAAAK